MVWSSARWRIRSAQWPTREWHRGPAVWFRFRTLQDRSFVGHPYFSCSARGLVSHPLLHCTAAIILSHPRDFCSFCTWSRTGSEPMTFDNHVELHASCDVHHNQRRHQGVWDFVWLRRYEPTYIGTMQGCKYITTQHWVGAGETRTTLSGRVEVRV